MNFKAIHLRTNPVDDREIRSANDVFALEKYGIKVVPWFSPVYEGEFPEPRFAPDRPFKLTSSHYGCYKTHRNAILSHLTTNIDALLLFECDAIWTVSAEEVSQRIERAWWACQEGKLDVFTFGPKHNGKTIDTVGDDVIVISQFIETHAYMVPLKSLSYFRETFAKPWDALDYVYTVYMYDQDKSRIGTFKDRPVSVQATGKSLITGQIKTEDHWKYKIYD